MERIDLAEKLSKFKDLWNPRIVAQLNDQYVKLVKLKGEFVWHSHEHEDELFLVLHGKLVLRFRDVPVRQPVVIQVPGQRRILFAVPWGTRTYLGTTDAPYHGEPGDSGVAAVEELEVLDIVKRVLGGAALALDPHFAEQGFALVPALDEVHEG